MNGKNVTLAYFHKYDYLQKYCKKSIYLNADIDHIRVCFSSKYPSRSATNDTKHFMYAYFFTETFPRINKSYSGFKNKEEDIESYYYDYIIRDPKSIQLLLDQLSFENINLKVNLISDAKYTRTKTKISASRIHHLKHFANKFNIDLKGVDISIECYYKPHVEFLDEINL
jgi:hypothetical protein